jgi:protein involved in polysaccharide export with SLBB domain
VIASTDDTLAELIVTVGGQAKRPGPVKYTRGLTLYNAVQAAGGATEFGSMFRVRLLRGNQLKEYDLHQTKFMNLLVEPNDTIEIPQKNIIGR